MTPEQIILLAIVQGITEFLPISSSGHLILIPAFTGWPDQGVATDVMVHVGSLLAVLVYFWRDCLALAGGGLDLLRLQVSYQGKLLIYILIATIPAALFGFYLKYSGAGAMLRSVEIIAWNLIVFGVFLYLADLVGRNVSTMDNMTLPSAFIIGIAQAAALIPGTSRSGITISAARLLGFKRTEAARFSFLLGIPAIAGAGLVTFAELLNSGDGIPADSLWAAFWAFFSALFAIAFLMAVVKHMSFAIFVAYRIALGLFLFAIIYEWIPGVQISI